MQRAGEPSSSRASPSASASASPSVRCRGGGATPPLSPTEPAAAVEQLEVAADIAALIRRTRKRKLEIVEREVQDALGAGSITYEPTSWERESAPSPSSWLAAAESGHENAAADDSAEPEGNRPPLDVSKEGEESSVELLEDSPAVVNGASLDAEVRVV